ncbi:MAG TPA: helix-turn-helix domain-containing protein [Puia sp.]|jgi:AraC-like DNA-binding protein|nr:helix-turn-helix domain-containing protein [Puia sp.]
MDLKFFLPHPALKEWINNIMIHRVDFDRSKPAPIFPFPPFPEQSLFFYPGDRISMNRPHEKRETEVPPAIVGGPTSDRINLRFGYRHHVIKVSFQPGGLYRLLGIPMHSLLGKDGMDARDIWGNQINLILEQLSETASFNRMKLIIEQFLFSKSIYLKPLLPIDSVMPNIVKGGGLIPIDHLASASCLSNRQFERVFKNRIGLSPKFFSRLVRFSRAWLIKENQPDISWLQLAYKCGYHDQMHFIRDFREFTGENPTEIELALRETPVNLKNGVFY